MLYFYVSNLVALISSGLIAGSACWLWYKNPNSSTRLMAIGSGTLLAGVLLDDVFYIVSWMSTPGISTADVPAGSFSYFYLLLAGDFHLFSGVMLIGMLLFASGYLVYTRRCVAVK